MGTPGRAFLPAFVALLVLGCSSITACATAPSDDPEESWGQPDAGERDPEPPESEEFDAADPNHYVWSVTAFELHTLPIVWGTVGVEYRWFGAGADPEVAEARGSGMLAPRTTLLDGVQFNELVSGSLRLSTLRTEDGFPMTSCVRRIEPEEAVSSHNQILAYGYPALGPEENYTNPERRREAVREQPGAVMLVEGDCTVSAPANPREERSVLSWLAVTIEAEPDPALIDPNDPPDLEGGIDLSGE